MPPSSTDPLLEFVVGPEAAGQRLDAFLAHALPKYSRVQLRKVIGLAGVKVNGQGTKVAHRLSAGDRISVVLPPMNAAGPHPEEIPLDILYEDEHIIAVNKPPGMVVHPARGHWSGTLASALSFHFRQLSSVGGPTRPGIVHRLDRDTSGVMVVAKTDPMHYALAAQFENRTTEKEYFAITAGVPDRDRDIIEQPIGMHPQQREKMAIRAGHTTSREATTFYEVSERFAGFAALQRAAENGPDASDSRASGPHRLPGAVRQDVRRARKDHARRAATANDVTEGTGSGIASHPDTAGAARPANQVGASGERKTDRIHGPPAE